MKEWVGVSPLTKNLHVFLHLEPTFFHRPGQWTSLPGGQHNQDEIRDPKDEYGWMAWPQPAGCRAESESVVREPGSWIRSQSELAHKHRFF
jgi:hypothetical protein